MRPESTQIVVLDADAESRTIVERLLTARGMTVAATGDAVSAANLAQASTTELLLVDLSMGVLTAVPRWARRRDDPEAPAPVTAGYAVLRSPSRDPLAGHLPLVAVRDAVSEAGSWPRYGVIDVVPKPVDGAALLLKVTSALAQDAPLPRGAPHRRPVGDESLPLAFDAIPRPLRTVLVVDSDTRFRQWIRGRMSIHGFEVDEAETGEEGLRSARSERPWLILSELHLAGEMDGATFCRRIRALTLTAHTPLLLLSDCDDYDDRYGGLHAGADDFVSKRVTAREILIRIQLVLKRYTDFGTRSGRLGAAIEGRLELIGAPGVLQMCHLGQFSGVLTVRHSAGTAEVHFREGQIIAARTPGASDADAIYDLLSWAEGRFEFVPGEPTDRSPLSESFQQLLLEGCRRLDEARRVALPNAF